jgi:DNA repair ATPase RecN
MNKQRRKEITKIVGLLEGIKESIEDLYNQEEEAKENMPDNLQYNSERWNQAEEATDNLEYAMSSVDETIEYLQQAMGEY